MTMLIPKTVTCSHCNASNEVIEMASTSSFGPPDLDLRPAEMARSTLHTQVYRCTGCGFASNNLETEEDSDSVVMQSVEYQHYLSSGLPGLAISFACCAMIEEKRGDLESTGTQWLKAAWVCDDEGIEEGRDFRVRAADALCRYLSNNGSKSENVENIRMVIIDVLRRARQFKEAADWCHDLIAKSSEMFLKKLAEYELTLIEASDDACHHVPDLTEGE